MALPISIFLLSVEAVCGAAGGFAAGRWSGSPGGRGNALLGAVGGLVLTWLATRVPHIDRLVGGVGSVLDSVVRNPGGIPPRLLVGVGISGLLGGVLSVLIRGAIWNRRGS